MARDARGYLYRVVRRADGRPHKEYLGKGRVADLIEQLDLLRREERAAERELERLQLEAEAERCREVDGPLDELDELAGQVFKAAMLAGGYHQHKRGEWRRAKT